MRYEISGEFLKPEEQNLFLNCMQQHQVDSAIWYVYQSFLQSSSPVTKPRIIRAYDDQKLAGAAFFVECLATGKTLFKNSFLAGATDFIKIPIRVWIRQGICADIMANPGFVADGYDQEKVISEILSYLRKSSLCLFITDLDENTSLHKTAKVFPYPKEGSITVEGMKSIDDYLSAHSNLRKRVKRFAKDGGTIEIFKGAMDAQTQKDALRCANATMGKSVIRTPFQDHFPKMIEQQCCLNSDCFLHMVARMNGKFLGYQTFIETGKGLRLIHGAFDRNLETTLHCYENLMTKAAEYAIQKGFECVYFGPIMNVTKQRMMNKADKTNTYFSSNNSLTRMFFALLYSHSRMQSKQMLEFV